ncbi:hypothetical protein VE01_07105 [Pseudogymnoascus verrucosus]|uniref:AAA+ ATPase domain-containing protein n=1 Tax=Pseudogymnoascus verrucosus TaxID=342668 RepID=A0A1B8GDV2_9PEZI|nr:uncharacterized protein VE01_07105 [Pseudogymnoascus verrucosus]OBT94006.1 hypothetical protein VE01_07105 [Pseudogymnoascus verrucosus]
MAAPHDTADALLSLAPTAPSNDDEGALGMTVSDEPSKSLNGPSHSPTSDKVKDQVVAVSQELGLAPNVSNNSQSVSKDNEGEDKEANEAHEQLRTSAPPLLLEIRALQERLFQLEQQASRQPNTHDPDIAAGADTGADVDGEIEGEEDKRLRKVIRRARWAKKSVEAAEKKAGETEKDRADYAYEGSFLAKEPTLYQVPNKDGDAPPDFATRNEYRFWTTDNKLNRPARAIRPLTSLQPIYSRKLGPPTQWDTSDSEEWSDGSTRSRDFDYFRARLRGDFEWELDRLHAQRKRYVNHKEKKKAAEEREKQEQEEKLGQEKLAEAGAVVGDPPTQQAAQWAVAKLHPVNWEIFKALRYVSEASCFAIDILIEEPKISDKTGGRHSKPNPLSADVQHQQTSGTGPAGELDGQGLLPERIRIHSRHLIMILARIHGSKLVSEVDYKNTSLVLLRPFRLLSYYDEQIRDWHSKLVDENSAPKSGIEGSNTNVNKTESSAEIPKLDADPKDTDQPSDSQPKKEPTVEDPQGLSTSTTALEHIPCLLEFMDTYITRKRAYLNSPTCNNIAFSDIWHLFKPGDFVISNDRKQAYRVINVHSPPHKGTDRWSYVYNSEKDNEKSRAQSDISIDCVYIHYDGKKFGPVLKKFKIRRFDGERLVTTLDIYPFRFHTSSGLRGPAVKSKQQGSDGEEVMETSIAQLRKKLIERGEMFVEVAGVKHMYYTGLTVDEPRDEVESQVVIDFEEAFASENSREWRPNITAIVGFAHNPEEDSEEILGCEADCCWRENVHDDSYVERERSEKFTNDLIAEMQNGPQGSLPSATIYPRTLEESKTKMNKFTEDELIIMSHKVFGFVLRDRTWAHLDLTHLEHIDNQEGEDDIDAEDEDSDGESGDKSAFGRLVLPRGHKKMVLSLIAQHFRNKGQQDEQADIVRGKGKGLIILLHGAPGVGKTTTAEGVAERFKKPLFQITCGDLGSNAKEVETALQTNFALANRWGCILLLDEADVFLAERRREDFKRNGLVAVFLRVLEYYAGILFLTTNRIGDFDEAFASRIHMSLHYPALGKIETIKVFKLNLGMIRDRFEGKRKIKIEEDEIIEDIGEYFMKNKGARWNGRQIRNACQTALALAEFEAQPLGKKYDLKKTESTTQVKLKAEHLKIVSDAYLEFIQYLKVVHGTDADTHAKESGTRALETVIAAIKASKGIATSKDEEEEEKPLSKFRLQGSRSSSG